MATTGKIIKSKRIVPYVDVVALVDSAANGAKVLLMKDGKRCDQLPAELIQFGGVVAVPAAPAVPVTAQLSDITEFTAAWRKIAGL